MIKENRIKKGYTQEQLAELIDISWRQLQRIEKNENNTKISTLKKIEIFFGSIINSVGEAKSH